jgi:membrane-bound metal-dependent hydrolase YbcI (DUF457 family)
MKLGADLWRRYSVQFNTERNEVVVKIGPVVTTSQVPYPDSEIKGIKEGRARAKPRMLRTYGEETTIDIFSGPSFSFRRKGDAVEITFLPWHRRWSHSLTLALLLGLLGGLAFGWMHRIHLTLRTWRFPFSLLHGLVISLAMAVHILEDQLGFMGSNLFYPFTKERTEGMKLIRSGDAIPNLLTVWTSLVFILFNLDRFSQEPALPPLPYFLFTLLIPWALILGINLLLARRREKRSDEELSAEEALEETEEVEF